MPKTTQRGEPRRSELPSTLRKSDAKAQRIFAEAHDSAVQTYGDGQRAHRVAYAALKHSYEKVGDHWEAKKHPGPSDPRSRSGGPDASGPSDVARRLDIHGRSTMNKRELVTAIQKANRRETRAGR